MFKIEKLPYPILIGLHVILGVLVKGLPVLAKVYLAGLFVYFLIRIFKSGDKNNEVLLAAVYFTVLEVYFRMTNAVPVYEAGKYIVLIFVLLGIFIKGFSIRALPFVIYILMFIPSIVVTSQNIPMDESLRKIIAFNLSGPVILGVVAVYCFDRLIKAGDFDTMLKMMVAAVALMTVQVFLYNPSVQDSITGTASNFATSGGFGPNQVATVFGIGMFATFARFMQRRSLVENIIDLSLFMLFTYRGYLTFSRGGVLTGFIMIVLFLVTVTVFTSKNFRLSFVPKLGMIFIGVVLAWGYTVNVSGGQIENRYTGVNARGVEKEDLSSGRGDLLGLEVQAFMENPILGIGAGMVKYYRAKKTGIEAASHNELSRLIAEQGIIGVLSILLLLVVPLFYRLGNKSNVYFYCFMAFWGATINHSAMRIAAPSMLYGLALLRFEQPTKKLKRNEEEPDELIELMREKRLLPKRRKLPALP